MFVKEESLQVFASIWIMKKIKRLFVLSAIALLCTPVVASATNDYYRDSYMMYRYADDNPSGSNCLAITEHNQRLAKAVAAVYHSNGTGNTQSAMPKITARASISTNRYNHTHKHWSE